MSERRYLSFRGDAAAAKILRGWWQALADSPAERADLRRTRSSEQVVFCPAFHRLLWKLRELELNLNQRQLATVAGVVAHVRSDIPDMPLGRLLGSARSEGGATPRLHQLRFQRLLAVEDREEIQRALVRLVRILEGAAPLLHLADAAYWWNEGIRKELAYEYYEGILS